MLFIFKAQVKEKEVQTMFDPGASGNFITKKTADKCGLTLIKGAAVDIRVANNETIRCDQTVMLPLRINSYDAEVPALVLPNDMKDIEVILGTTWVNMLPRGDIRLSSHERSIAFLNPKSSKLVKVYCEDRPLPKKSELQHLTFDMITGAEAVHDINFWQHKEDSWNDDDKAFILSDECQFDENGNCPNMLPYYVLKMTKGKGVKKEGSFEVEVDCDDEQQLPNTQIHVDNFHTKFGATLFGEDLPPYDLQGKTPVTAIKPKAGCENERPFNKARRMDAKALEALQKQLDELLSKGYIKPSSSPYGAPVLMVPKPHQPDKLRLVIDYRAINRITERDRYPLPNTEQLFEALQGAKVFSTFDALWGFWQQPLAKEEQEKTAMVTPFGSFEWKSLPMGLTNAPSVFMRAMENATRDLRDKNGKQFIKIFIDDVLIYSTTVEEHTEHLTLLFKRLEEKKILLKGSKAKWYQNSVKFLGHVISAEGCKPQSNKVQCIKDWPRLTSVTEIRQFLGLIGFYKRYVSGFAEKAKGLNDLLKKDAVVDDTTIVPGTEAHDSFEALKKAITEAPTIVLPNQDTAASGEAPYVIQTDASGFAIGACIMQDQGHGLQPIAFISRSLNAAEQNYSTTERELLGIVHATWEWRHLIVGSHCKLQGDHKPLEALFSPGKELTRRQARWIEKLIQVGVPEMEHVPGKSIPVPDALSRMPGLPVYTAAEGLQAQLKPTMTSDVDPDYMSINLLTSWKLSSDQLPVPQPINLKTGMVHFLNPKDTAHHCFHMIQWMQHLCADEPLHSLLELRRSPRLNPPATIEPSTSFTSSAKPAPTAKVNTPQPTQATKLPIAKANSDWKLVHHRFQELEAAFGPFDVDACCDPKGVNKQAGCPTYWSKNTTGQHRSCFLQNWEGKRIYCNPPWEKPFFDQILKKFTAAYSLWVR